MGGIVSLPRWGGKAESFRTPSSAWGTSCGVSQFTGRVPRFAAAFFSFEVQCQRVWGEKRDGDENVNQYQAIDDEQLWTICTTK